MVTVTTPTQQGIVVGFVRFVAIAVSLLFPDNSAKFLGTFKHTGAEADN